MHFDGTASYALENRIVFVETLSARAHEARVAAAQIDPPIAATSPTAGQVPEISADASFLLMIPQREQALEGMDAYSYDDWDLEGARAVSPDVQMWTKSLLRLLHPLLPNPDVSPAPTGSLCMEWARGADLVWADVEPDGKVLTLTKYAGKKTESVFDSANGAVHYLDAQLQRLFA